MRLLESAPGRYDVGILVLTLGGISRLYERIADLAVPRPGGLRVLEIGCGTAALTAWLAPSWMGPVLVQVVAISIAAFLIYDRIPGPRLLLFGTFAGSTPTEGVAILNPSAG